MAVKYVNDFAFDSGFGFSGSSGKTPVKSHMRSPMKKGMGGAVKAGPKAPSIAPAMVEKRSQGLGGLAKETKKLAAYNKPHMEGKKGAKVAMYAKGGAVKKAHAKKEMPSFLKAKMMKKADGGEIGIAEDPTYEERMNLMRQRGDKRDLPDIGTPQRFDLTPEQRDELRIRGDSAFRAADLADRLASMTREGMGETRGGVGEAIPPMLPIADTRARLPEPRRELTPEERAKYMDIFDMSGPPKPVYDSREGMGETRGGVGEAIPPMPRGGENDFIVNLDSHYRLNPPQTNFEAPTGPRKSLKDYARSLGMTVPEEQPVRIVPMGAQRAAQASPLAAVAAARRQAMMPNADLMRRAGEAVRGRMPAPRRAMPVAPKAPMIERGRPMPMAREDIVRSPRQMMQQRGPRGVINRLRDQIARRVPRGEVMPQPQTIPGRQPALDIGNLPKPPPGYKPKQYIASGDIRFNPETGEYGPSIFREIIDTAPPAGFVPTLEGRFAKGGRVTKGEKKIGKVMGEFKRGELHSGSKKGPVVKNPKQAVAIALSEARQAGAKIPKKKAMGGRACD